MTRPARAETRLALVSAAARILADEGPQALSTRRLAAEVGASTMAVYTYFGSMQELVRAVVREGFARLAGRLARVPTTTSPLADTTRLAHVYRRSALEDSQLYRVMFGGSSVAGFELSIEDRRLGAETFEVGVEAVRRCVEAGHYTPGDPREVARQLWVAVHGLVMLELNGYLFRPGVADACFDGLLRSFHLGAGCPPALADEAVRGTR